MLRSKTLLMFLLKALVFYTLLSLPISAYDEAYGNFYRKLSDQCFGHFRGSGFAKFNSMKDPAMTHVNVGNYALKLPDGSFDTAAIDINTRILGYIPTILFISLVLASPVPWKRRLVALGTGMILVMLLVIFKHWISLLWLCEENAWLKLTNFTGFSKTVLTFTNTFISSSSFTVPYFVVGIWLLVTFRLDDLKEKPQAPAKNK
jgi:hypothetical protein